VDPLALHSPFVGAADWLDAIPVAACVVDQQLQVRLANPRFRTLLPRRSASLSDLFRECDAGLPASVLQEALLNGTARAEFLPVDSNRRHLLQGGKITTNLEEGCLLTVFPLEYPISEAETRYRLLAGDVAADGLVLFDESGAVFHANQAAASLRGTQPPRLQRMSWSVIYPLVTDFRHVVQEVETSGRWEGETKIERYDGGLATLDVVVTHLEQGVYCAHERDVSLQKLAEYVFLETERLNEAFFSQSLDGFFITLSDAPIEQERLSESGYVNRLLDEFRLAKANDAALVQFGLDRTGFSDCTFGELFGPPARAHAMLSTLLAQGRHHAELPLLVQGIARIIEGSYIVLRDDDEKIIGFFGIQRDITERKQNEALLLQRTRTLEGLYELATTAGTGEEMAGQMLHRIAALLDFPIVCLTAQVFGGRTWMLAPGSAVKVTENIGRAGTLASKVLAEGRPLKTTAGWSELFGGSAPEGYGGRLSFVGCPVRGRDGQVYGALCAAGSCLPEEESESLRLIELFAAYTGHEFERQLLSEQVLKARNLELLGRITAGVAHEVRNPLNAIASITEALRLDLGSANQYDDYLNHMGAQVKRLSTLMQDLLELGRPLNASLLHEEAVDDIIAAGLSLWRQSNQGRHVEVHGKLPGMSILADGARMQQALINVLDNAAQHSRPDTALQVFVEQSGNRVRLRIVDQGAGIPADALDKVFEPFFTRRRLGTGLGMSIVKHIIEAHGGTVSVRNNEPGPGATAEFILPLYKSIR
jgi:PAS domain-containing protein